MEGKSAHEATGARRDSTASPRRWTCTGWGLPRSLDAVRFRDVAVLLLVGLTVWGYVDVSRRGRVVPGVVEAHRTDFTVYTEAGAAFFDGRDPYRVTNPRGWFYLYPPLLALLVSPLAAFDGPTQVGVWYALSVAAAFGCYGEARRLWRWLEAARPTARLGPRRGLWLGACAGLAALFPTLECLQRGQVGIVLLYLLMLGFRLVVEGQRWPAWFLGGVVLALPAVIKLIPLLPVSFVLLQRWAAVLAGGRGRRPTSPAIATTAGVAAGGFLFLFLIPAACVGWRANLHHLQTWCGRVVANPNVDHATGFNIYSVTNQSFANAAHLLAVELSGTKLQRLPAAKLPEAFARRKRVDVAVSVGTWAVRAATLALLLALGTAGCGRDAHGEFAAFGLACGAILVLSPLTWTHYYMFLFPAMLGVPLWLAVHGRPRAARVAAIVPVLLSLAHYVAAPRAGSIGLLGLGTTAWVLVFGGWIAAGSLRRSGRGPRAAVACRPVSRLGRTAHSPLTG